MQVLPNILEGIKAVAARLLPAKLNQTSTKNVILILGWLAEENLLEDPNTPPAKIADVLEQEIRARLLNRELVWDEEPAKLKNERLRKANISTDEKPLNRGELSKEVEARDAYAALQKKSEEQIKNLIDGFSPANRRGSINYPVKEAVQKQLREHLAKEKARGVNLADVFPKLQEFVEKKYREIERSIERL